MKYGGGGIKFTGDEEELASLLAEEKKCRI